MHNVFKRKVDIMSEEMLVRHCAPTLMGLKTGNMFSCRFETKLEEHNALTEMNKKLTSKGLRVIPLRHHNGATLIYLYRPSKLKKDLSSKQAADILKNMGYCCENANLCLVSLMKRLRQSDDFPHEIGLFLGYPPEDVCGFIDNNGCNCKCVGCWKVYGDENKAKQTFDKYKRCTELCCSLVERGLGIENLAVSDKTVLKA